MVEFADETLAFGPADVASFDESRYLTQPKEILVAGQSKKEFSCVEHPTEDVLGFDGCDRGQKRGYRLVLPVGSSWCETVVGVLSHIL